MDVEIAIQNIEKALNDANKLGVFQTLQDSAVIYSSLEIIKEKLKDK